ncbi:MAG: ABC transporter ATP-binding protein [Armatimonadota bacterium]|nr:ABC transporter ATP-binding protein [Armatimonadota bacterium]MDR7550422.1 ABC transporter ATP-binding protein [Armatimonadota bacterium]
MGAAAVSLEDITKYYDSQAAVDHLSLSVEPGSFTTLLGPSGCGKTTLLRLVAGFIRPDLGDIKIDGRSVVDLPPYRRPTATVFQEYALFPHLTVFENVAYGLRLRRLPPAEVRRRVEAALDLLNISGLEGRSPGSLSGGQQQRVALARALVVEPRVLLMDEPLSNLDAKLRSAVRSELKALHRRLGITTVYVTHDQEEALFLSDWIAVIRSGRLVQYGAPQEIYERPVDPFVADFVGQANFLDGTVVACEAGEVTVAVDGTPLRIQGAVPLGVGQRVRLAVRPAVLELSHLPPPDGNALPGTIRFTSYLGQTSRHFIMLGDSSVIVDRPAGPPLPPGAAVYVVIPRHQCWIFTDARGT